MWRQFSVSSEDCVGSKCAYIQDCHSAKARAALKHANVIVVNYSLLFSHIKVKEAVGRDVILPAFDVLIMDEGHEAAEWARGFLGFRVSHYAIDRIARDVGGGDEVDLSNASTAVFTMLDRYYNSKRYKTRLREPDFVPYDDICMYLRKAQDNLGSMVAAATDPMERASLSKSAQRAGEIAGQIERAMTDRDGDHAYYIDQMRGGSISLCSKPVHVGEWVRENLFDNTPTVVVTSATLATGSGFDYVAEELGADHYDELIVSSPFDWKRQAITVLPKMPDPREEAYGPRMAQRVLECIEQAQGRTMALFTSYRNLNLAHGYLQDEDLPYKLLKQGEAPRSQLIDDFKSDVDSVLLATTSFWSGVDVPGLALSCLVLDKLPFPQLGDPVLDLLGAQDSRSFFNHSVPRAIIALKQGVGRLIRTVDDYGVVVLLDCRLTTKGYGREFLESLPGTHRTRKMTEIGRFLEHMRVAAEGAQDIA